VLEIQDSDAVAIVNHQYQVLYSNESFNILNNFDIDPGKMKVCENLKPLGLLNWDSKKYNAQTSCIYHEDLDIFVYILNRSSHENFFLILIKNPGGRRKLISETQDNRYMGKEEFEPEELLPEFKGVVGESIRFRRALMLAQRAARSDVPVLILGESGTGKEMVAQAIHRASSRRNKQLVDVNCAAIPATLIESELFGVEKGAYTGADKGRPGYIEMASGGTLFLDEIGDLPVTAQARLLRFLQEKTFERVGGTKTLRVDIRLVSATNQNLEEMVAKGGFREDLFYRLCVVRIKTPALRQRQEDIPRLVDHFVNHYSEIHNRPITGLDRAARDFLKHHPWPGNVRELMNCLECMVVSAVRPQLTLEDIPEHLRRLSYPKDCLDSEKSDGMLARSEKQLITDALQRTGMNKVAAAKMLGIGLRTLYRKIDKWGL